MELLKIFGLMIGSAFSGYLLGYELGRVRQLKEDIRNSDLAETIRRVTGG